MINLKLAEYKDGKFQSFLEHFAYCKNYIIVTKHLIEEYIRSEDFIDIDDCFFKDEKDPLNRFNGLFDGRTYGKGRFVLIESKIINRFGKALLMSQDDIFSYNKYYQLAVDFINFHHWQETEDNVEQNKNFNILGNLHENPELYKKLKI
jgi:hypothetical protein